MKSPNGWSAINARKTIVFSIVIKAICRLHTVFRRCTSLLGHFMPTLNTRMMPPPPPSRRWKPQGCSGRVSRLPRLRPMRQSRHRQASEAPHHSLGYRFFGDLPNPSFGYACGRPRNHHRLCAPHCPSIANLPARHTDLASCHGCCAPMHMLSLFLSLPHSLACQVSVTPCAPPDPLCCKVWRHPPFGQRNAAMRACAGNRSSIAS